MDDQRSVKAWNNFVLRSEPDAYESGSKRRFAAIASQYQALANNGGINSFLTCAFKLDAKEVLEALVCVGALTAAKEFTQVLHGLGVPVPSQSQDERFCLLDRHWSDALDANDVLSVQADEELTQVLQRHVREYEDFYLTLE